MAKIKICGLRREEDITFVNRLKPDYAGFILSRNFRRSIGFSAASDLKGRLSGDIKAVGVFVDEAPEVIETARKMKIIDMVQLHGNESPEYCSRIHLPLIKALKPGDFGRISEYEPFVDYFLFDSGTGTGKTFDWSSIPKTNKPFFLAGGISSSNVEEAVRRVNPFAVDASSSVETDGFKDYEKIKELIERTRL